MPRDEPVTLLDIPDCMLESIFEFMSYDEVARKRIVCRGFDKAGQRVLNRGFNKMVKTHAAHLKRLKALLPRRESERRNHPLSRHTDILACIETRISMLSMTYSKYIDLNLCCFIPGKVIDEVYNIFKLIDSDIKPLRAHEVLQELRDISSMAIEHFDEKIANGLKKSYMTSSPGRLSVPVPAMSTSSELLHLAPPPLSVDDICDIGARRCDGGKHCRQARLNKIALNRMEARYRHGIKKFNQMLLIQKKQMHHLRCNSLRISQLTTQVAELKRQIEESEAKNREIKANINQFAHEADSSIAAPLPMRNIKPRSATIILKRRITEPIGDAANLPDLKQIKLDAFKDKIEEST